MSAAPRSRSSRQHQQPAWHAYTPWISATQLLRTHRARPPPVRRDCTLCDSKSSISHVAAIVQARGNLKGDQRVDASSIGGVSGCGQLAWHPVWLGPAMLHAHQPQVHLRPCLHNRSQLLNGPTLLCGHCDALLSSASTLTAAACRGSRLCMCNVCYGSSCGDSSTSSRLGSCSQRCDVSCKSCAAVVQQLRGASFSSWPA